jgi:hypothetical protein
MKNLTIQDIIHMADEAYPDSRVRVNFNPETGKATASHHGDGLANFIVRELCDTFDPKAPRRKQLEEAHWVMASAVRELESVRDRFEHSLLAGNRNGGCGSET